MIVCRFATAFCKASLDSTDPSGVPRMFTACVYSKQVAEEHLHPLRSIERVLHEIVSVRIEQVAASSAKQLRVYRDHAQRLLQVMRSRVSELIQVLVCAP